MPHQSASTASGTVTRHAPATAGDILFVTRKWAPAVGGMETWSHQIAETLDKHAEVDVVALPGREDGSPPSILRLLLFPFTFIARLLRRRTPATLLIGDMALWPFAMIARLKGKPGTILIAAHGTDVAFHRRGGFKGRLYGAYLRIGAKLTGSAKVIANSRATAEVAAETGWTDSIVIPLAADCGAIKPAPSHNGKILFAGRLVTRKGCGWFVREVLPALPETVRLSVAGTRWDAAEDFVLEDPRVEFLGPLDKDALSSAYAESLCVIVPNIDPLNGEYEGFGLVAPEAAAAGAVVLASDHGGLKDAVLDGETGILLPSGFAQAWIETITQVLNWTSEHRAQFTQNAALKAREHYCWDRVARQVLEAAEER